MCSLVVAVWSVQSVPIKGCVHVRVQIQSMSQVVKLLVIDLTGDNSTWSVLARGAQCSDFLS